MWSARLIVRNLVFYFYSLFRRWPEVFEKVTGERIVQGVWELGLFFFSGRVLEGVRAINRSCIQENPEFAAGRCLGL